MKITRDEGGGQEESCWPCVGLALATNQMPTQLLMHSTLPWDGEKTEGKWEDLWMEIMTFSSGRQKLYTQAKQKEEFIRYFPPAGRYPAASWKVRLQHTWQLLGKTTTITTNIPPPSSVPWAIIAEHDIVWPGKYPFGQCTLAVPAVSPPDLMPTPNLFTEVRWCRAEWAQEKVLLLCKPCSGTARTSVGYQLCFSHRSKAQHCMGCYGEN